MEVAEMPAQTIAEPLINQGKEKLVKPFFNSENARAYALKGVAARAQAKADHKRMIAEAKLALLAQAEIQTPEAYRLSRLARIRSQLASVDSAIENCIKERKPDQSRLKGLVEAQARLADQEQKLSMRPLPGSHRPRTPKASKTSHTVEPLEE